MQKHTVKIKSIKTHSDAVKTLYFTLPDGSVFDYVPGQYITVYFEDSSTPEGKAYSLSSAPFESSMSITVKKIGEFSGKLHNLKVGDNLSISVPYGFFNPLNDRPLVCIGAGVGIAPIWSIIKSDLQASSKRNIDFFYTNKYLGDVPFKSEQAELQANHDNYRFRGHLTRDESAPKGFAKKRIDLDEAVSIDRDAFYLLCGSIEFVKAMFDGLTSRGVAKDSISTEIFFEG